MQILANCLQITTPINKVLNPPSKLSNCAILLYNPIHRLVNNRSDIIEMTGDVMPLMFFVAGSMLVDTVGEIANDLVPYVKKCKLACNVFDSVKKIYNNHKHFPAIKYFPLISALALITIGVVLPTINFGVPGGGFPKTQKMTTIFSNSILNTMAYYLSVISTRSMTGKGSPLSFGLAVIFLKKGVGSLHTWLKNMVPDRVPLGQNFQQPDRGPIRADRVLHNLMPSQR